MLDIVDVISAGMLGVELNLQKLADDITGTEARYNPEHYPGLYLRFGEDEPLITVYRTVKFIVSGLESKEVAYRTGEKLVRLFRKMGVVDEDMETGFSVHNYVCTGI